MKIFEACLLTLVTFSTASANEEIQTPYGVLKASEVATDGAGVYALTLGGQQIGKVEADILSLYRVTAPPEGPAYIIIAKQLSGLHCRHEFLLVKVSSSTSASLSNSFGNCMELAGATLLQDGVKISLESPVIPNKKPESEEWTWRNGILSKSSASGEFLHYLNNKYSFSIDYPAAFAGHGEPDAGDGQTFTSPNNDAVLTTSASYCGDGLYSPAKFIADHKQDEKEAITYSRQTKNFAVVSGTQGGRIFYEKLLTNGVQCAKFRLEYDISQKDRYNPITAHIAGSLKQWQD